MHGRRSKPLRSTVLPFLFALRAHRQVPFGPYNLSHSTAPNTMQPTVKALILSDWAPHIEKTVRMICIPIAATYVLGMMAGSFIHQLNDALAAIVTPRQPQPAPVILQRCATPSPRNIAAPDPMAKAVAAVMGGSSQAAAAKRFGVSRSTLRRRLAK